MLDLSCGECDVISLYFMCCSVNVSVCLVCCVFASVCELLEKQFAICLGVIAILLLNVMDVFIVWVEVLCWIDRVLSSKECACCACDPSVYLSVHSIGCLRFCMSEVISSFKSLRAGSHVCSLLMLFLCVILHTMWSGKSLQLVCCACLPSV